jgi:hypothetical protein
MAGGDTMSADIPPIPNIPHCEDVRVGDLSGISGRHYQHRREHVQSNARHNNQSRENAYKNYLSFFHLTIPFLLSHLFFLIST